MKINKLNDNIFLGFASQHLGIDAGLYRHDLEIKRTEKGVILKIYLGGEIEDERKYSFKDEKCIFSCHSINASTKDVSYEWVMYVVENADELIEEEKQEIIDAYNRNIENDIDNYATQKREYLIS